MKDIIIRKAKISDVRMIHGLLFNCAQKGLLLARSFNQIYGALRDFYVAEMPDGSIGGCCALTISWEDLGEIRSLVVDERHRKEGLGKKLVEECLAEARFLGLKRIFALTYVEGFFGRLGFEIVEKDILPQKVWTDCINCPKFPDCDETAVLLTMEQQ